MFPLAHVHYSLLVADGPDEQVIGSILPDAAFTAVVSWTDLHHSETSAAFFDHVGPRFAALVEGIRHHAALDARSHDDWRGATGYAYERQTDELRLAVGRACDVDGELARVLAHNFIESAVDLHLFGKRPDVAERLHTVLCDYDLSELSEVIATWKGTAVTQVRAGLDVFVDTWKRARSIDIDVMVDLWADLLSLLDRHTFDRADRSPLDRGEATRAIEIACALVASDFLDVVTP
jgi:hypothetical protein